MQRPTINPIIPGFSPDPSIVVIDGTFFLVTSSFHVFPGLPIYASTDLVSWTHIGNAINRKDQLSLARSRTRLIQTTTDGEALLATGGLYAPTIRHFEGTTYIVCTNVIHEESVTGPLFENFIISTSDIWGNKWSDPIPFEFCGIDPDIFFDDDQKTYILGSAYTTGPPWVSRIAIDCFEIDLKSGKKLSPQKEVWDGFSKIVPEGPHVYKRNGWYYLLVAEGGTSEGHRIAIARSRSIWGPYSSSEFNPILGVCDNESDISHTGHGDLFQALDGEWWIVCLGVRKENGTYVMGRETFLAPVQWPEGGWPSVQPVVSNPEISRDYILGPWGACSPSGGHDLVHIRDPDPQDYNISPNGNIISIRPRPRTLMDPVGPISFAGKRQRVLQGESKVSLDISTVKFPAICEAGLAYYKDEFRSARICFVTETNTVAFMLENTPRSLSETVERKIPSGAKLLQFRISYTSQQLEFSFIIDTDAEWTVLSCIRSQVFSSSDFVGPIIGVYAVSNSNTHFLEFQGLEVM